MNLTESPPVNEEEHFNPLNYPIVEKELLFIRQAADKLPLTFKGEMVISFYKDHCLKYEYVTNHPEFTKMITSRHFQTTQIESLFVYGRSNKIFLREFEKHVKKVFSNPTQ